MKSRTPRYLRQRVDLKEFTTFHIGGIAQYFTEVKNINQIGEVAEFADKKISLFAF